MPLDRFLAEHIFRPLRMTDTYFYVPDEKVAWIAVPYTFDERGQLQPMDLVQHVKVPRLGHFVVSGKGSRGSRVYFSGGSSS